jgi:hypothetical protein
MSRSNDVGAPCLNETWGSSSMFSSDCLDLPGLWNKKLGVLESPGSLFTCVAPLTIISFTAEDRGQYLVQGQIAIHRPGCDFRRRDRAGPGCGV